MAAKDCIPSSKQRFEEISQDKGSLEERVCNANTWASEWCVKVFLAEGGPEEQKKTDLQ